MPGPEWWMNENGGWHDEYRTLVRDEDIAVQAGGDYVALCPSWQTMAYGSDGFFATGLPWILQSSSVNFETNGVQPNHVVHITGPRANFPGGGALLAVDSASGPQLTLRRLYKQLGIGQPPSPIAVPSGVTFNVLTLDQQNVNASFDIKRRFGIDDRIPFRGTDWVYDLQDLRLATVLSVLYDRYTSETRTDKGDFPGKVKRIRQQLDDALARVQVRWGPLGGSEESTTIFSCKLSR